MMASKHNSMTKLRKAQIVYRKQKSDNHFPLHCRSIRPLCPRCSF